MANVHEQKKLEINQIFMAKFTHKFFHPLSFSINSSFVFISLFLHHFLSRLSTLLLDNERNSSPEWFSISFNAIFCSRNQFKAHTCDKTFSCRFNIKFSANYIIIMREYLHHPCVWFFGIVVGPLFCIQIMIETDVISWCQQFSYIYSVSDEWWEGAKTAKC